MEIGEAAALADQFSLSLVCKVHSLPISERSSWARRWRQMLGTSLGVRQALDEQGRQMKIFAAARRVDRARDRQMFVTLSALVDDDGSGQCPALSNGRCGIYERRPLTCRTVPVHYSRPPSTLASYLDGFTRTPGYECETLTAPPILSVQGVLSEQLCAARDQAVRQAAVDRVWKAALIERMGHPDTALAAGLPTVDDVIRNSDRGYASTVPMLAAWRVALGRKLITAAAFEDICRRQLSLLQRSKEAPGLADRRALYRDAVAQGSARFSPDQSLAG